MIDYDLISQVLYHFDGYAKNWIWYCWDGNKWTPTSYDMDSIFGIHWDGSFYRTESITTILGITQSGNELPTDTNLLKWIYDAELKERYKKLRDKGGLLC